MVLVAINPQRKTERSLQVAINQKKVQSQKQIEKDSSKTKCNELNKQDLRNFFNDKQDLRRGNESSLSEDQ